MDDENDFKSKRSRKSTKSSRTDHDDMESSKSRRRQQPRDTIELTTSANTTQNKNPGNYLLDQPLSSSTDKLLSSQDSQASNLSNSTTIMEDTKEERKSVALNIVAIDVSSSDLSEVEKNKQHNNSSTLLQEYLKRDESGNSALGQDRLLSIETNATTTPSTELVESSTNTMWVNARLTVQQQQQTITNQQEQSSDDSSSNSDDNDDSSSSSSYSPSVSEKENGGHLNEEA
jgi:hypothetical protein